MSNFAVSTICFGPEADACEVLDFAIRHGFQGIELSSYHFWPERLRADQHVGDARALADVEHRHPFADEIAHVVHRPQRHVGGGEGKLFTEMVTEKF